MKSRRPEGRGSRLRGVDVGLCDGERQRSFAFGSTRAYLLAYEFIGLCFRPSAYVDRLREAGLDEKEARAHAEALDVALRDGVAAKSDIDRLETKIKSDMDRLEAKIETSAANLKVEILRSMMVTQLVVGGLLFAAFTR